MEPSTSVFLQHAPKRKDYTFSRADFIMVEDTDIAVFNLPKSFETFSNITPKFWTNEDTKKYLPDRATLLIGPGTVPCLREHDVSNIQHQQKVGVRGADGKVVTIHDVLSYDYSEAGICGALLLRHNHQRPILAMHCVGNVVGVGNGVIITQELLTSLATDHIMSFQFEEVELGPLTQAKVDLTECGYIKVLGTVTGNTPFQSTKSKIKPSRIHGMLSQPPQTEPVILSAHDERYIHPKTPLMYGVEKHGQQTLDPPTHIRRHIGEVLYEHHFRSMRPVVAQPRQLTLGQAVVGIPGMEHYDPMRLGTSAGYPWCLKSKTSTTKEVWVDVERDKNQQIITAKLHPELEAEI